MKLKTVRIPTPKLVANWQECWKWLSMWFALAIAAWPLVPEEQQAEIVSGIASLLGIEVSVTTVLAFMLMLSRVIDQKRGLL